MAAYLIRRVVYGFFTVLGVLLLLFVLFFAVTDADDIARKAVGERARPEVYAQWKKNHGYDRPLLVNRAYPAADLQRYTDTLLFDHYRRMLTFDFGSSDADDSAIARRLKEGAGPSLSLTVPLFAFGLAFRRAAGAVRGLFSRDLYRSRRARVVHVDHEHRRLAVYHRRAVFDRHAAEVVSNFRLRLRSLVGGHAFLRCPSWSASFPALVPMSGSTGPSLLRKSTATMSAPPGPRAAGRPG